MYVATLTGSILASVQGKYGVDSVSPDGAVWVAAPSLTRRGKPPPPPPAGFNKTLSQFKAPWHLPMVSSRKAVTTPSATYFYNATAGAGGELLEITATLIRS